MAARKWEGDASRNAPEIFAQIARDPSATPLQMNCRRNVTHVQKLDGVHFAYSHLTGIISAYDTTP